MRAQAGAGPVDNLYIDMNGIIHPCFHPENGEAPATEQECFEAILAYIDALLYIVRPRRMLYLAVDGPAPRAKMNQQRGRRFKSAAEADQKKRVEQGLRDEWARQGKAPPPAKSQPLTLTLTLTLPLPLTRTMTLTLTPTLTLTSHLSPSPSP